MVCFLASCIISTALLANTSSVKPAVKNMVIMWLFLFLFMRPDLIFTGILIGLLQVFLAHFFPLTIGVDLLYPPYYFELLVNKICGVPSD